MNISLTNRTTTQVELVAPSFRENIDGNIFCAILEDHYIYIYESYSGDFRYIKTEAIKQDENIDPLSSFGRVLTSDEYIDSTQGRFEAKLAQVFVDMTTFRKEVQP
jgi:hypothetical protein